MQFKRLVIYTRNLVQLKKFYAETLGFALEDEAEDKATIRIGDSLVTLKEHFGATPYHFAINIPSFSEDAALEWLKDKAPILRDNGREIQEFASWNARSVYFYDPDQNIVEFISRRNLGYPFEAPFGAHSLCEISEIGMATTGIETLYALLHRTLGLHVYDGDLERFCAIGNEQGLLICINRHVKTWYPTGDMAFPSDFELEVTVGNNEYALSYREEKLQINPSPRR